MEQKKKKKKLEPISIKGVGKRGKNPFVDFNPRDPDPKRFAESVAQSLQNKSASSDLPLDLLFEVFERGIDDYFDSGVNASRSEVTPQQWAFARVNSFIAGGRALELDEDLVSEAKQYRITKQTSNKSLGRLARRTDALGAQARAELASRRSDVFASKSEASKKLGEVLHGKSKLDHPTAKKIIRTLGMNPKSAAAKTLTATGRAHEQRQQQQALRRKITKEVKSKLKADSAKSQADLLDALKNLKAVYNRPPVQPTPPHAPKTHDIRSTPGGPNLHLPRRSDINPDVGPKAQPKTGILSRITSLLKRKK